MPCWTTRSILGFALLFASLTTTSSLRADDAPAPKKIATIEGITEYKFPNGLRLLLFPDPSTSTVTVNLTIFVGSRHEGYGETGMAHLLEHMVFKGTPSMKDIPKALRDHGAEFNGSTWVDRTNYYETMPASDDNLEFGVKMEADRFMNSLIRREDLLSEMTVVRNEFEMGENQPESILSQRMTAVAFEWHNYGKSTIGNRSDIERVPIDRLQAFYRKFYRPDNAMLVIAGKFDTAKALSVASKYFGVLKNPPTPLEITYTEEPAQDGERSVVLRRVGKVGVVGAMYHIPAGAHPDYPAMEVLEQLLVSQPSGRLYKALVESKLATRVSGAIFPFHDPGILEFLAQVEPGKSLETVRDTLTQTLEQLGKDKVTAEELDRAKRKLLKDRELLMAKSNRIGIVLSEWGALGDWRLFFLHRDRLEKVTAADVDRVAAKYLETSNRTVGFYIPTDKAQRTTIPETPAIAKLVDGYKGRQAVVEGQAFDSSPENIAKNVQSSTLVPGVKLAMLPKKSRGETVVVEVALHYGSLESLSGKTSATQFVATLMAKGTKKHTRQQLDDEFDKLKARFQASGLLGNATFSIECTRANLPAALALLGEVLHEPTFPEKEFDVLKRRLLESLEKSLVEPSALASRAMQRRLTPYPPEDVRYVPTVEESIDRLKRVKAADVQKLYEDLLGANGEVVVVGDFDPEATKAQLTGIFQDWKAKVPYERIPRPANTSVRGTRIVIETPDKANAFYFAGEMLAMTDTDPDFPALEVGSFLFGGGTLSSRLGNRVRQQEGLSYGIASQFSADPIDKSGRFSLFAISNPANMGKVDKAIAEELEKLLKDGVAEKELEEAKKAYLQQLQVDRSRDASLAGLLQENAFAGRTFAYNVDLEKSINGLTVDQVNRAIRKHWDPAKLVIVHAGDFKAAGSAK